MPYRVIWESNHAVWTKFSGVVTYAEALGATNAFYGDPRCDTAQCAFWDFTDIDGFVVDGSEVEEMAFVDHVASLYMRPLKSAFVLRDPALLELAEQYVAQMRELGSPWQNRIFGTMDEARQWAMPES